MPNCNTIAICNQKGGVGKTTTTVNLGVGLAMQGKKVLLVDADPQGDLTTCLGWKDTDNLPVALPDKMVEVMQDKCKEPMKGILHHKEGVDLIPSNSDLFDFEISLVTAMNREAILRNYLNEVKYNYDYIIIDCSPSLGMMTLNALSAADSVIIPVQAHYLPAKCMTQLMRTITKVKKHINPKLNIDGILLTLVDNRTNLAKSTIDALRENFGSYIKIYNTHIPIAIKAAEVSSKGKSIYVKNPDQSETVRMIYDMYLDGKGTMVIANELTRLQRLNASGLVKWNAGVVSRILNNQTYMGVMAYGKSYSNNYLEQKRVNNHDASTYMCVKADFEPIVSEEEWYKCQEIKARRVRTSFKSANEATQKKKTTHGIKENKDLWGSKLLCTCGHSFRKNRWHKNKGMPWSYGYQCYNQLNNGSASQRRKAGADDTGYCDQSMIADWKLEMMAKMIFEQIWQERKETVDTVCELIKECYQVEKPKKVNLTGIVAQIERYKNKKNTLLEMRTDGEISKEEYKCRRRPVLS